MSIVEQIAAQQINTATVATVEEVAVYLRLSKKTVSKMCEARMLKATDCGMGGRHRWRIPWANVLQSRTEEGGE
jgi:excisionase family DNA binding protein